ncbi:MAG TPA: FtsX-like permease family protein [Terriglobales bacterium]|nr:FtsX-like permease family protein [Terriglobales bacterium]
MSIQRSPRRPSMFLRMLLRAAVVRRSRLVGALIAITVSAAVATALLNLYSDAQSKLREDFRGYGANVIVTALDGETLPPDAAVRVQAEVSGLSYVPPVVVPYGYVVARTAEGLNGSPVVVSGTDFSSARALNTWWSVSNWPSQNGQTAEALFGQRAAQALTSGNSPVDLWFHGKKIRVVPSGILKTGAEEDSRIYIDLGRFENWTGTWPSAIEVRVPGSADQVKSAISHLQSAMPTAQVRPVRQIVEAEARVLGRTRSMLFWTTLAVIATSALCVLATLMSWVLDRRRDFAVMKALGASERLIAGFFAAEAALVGGIGAVIGFVLGISAAEWIGHVSFGSSVTPHFRLMPLVFAGGIILALAAASGPLGVLRRIQPAAILRGE